MVNLRSLLAVTVAALLLSGCSFADRMWSGIAGGGSSSGRVIVLPPPQADSKPPSNSAGSTASATPGSNTVAAASTFSFTKKAAPAPTAGATAGTFVGQKVQALRADLQRLQDNIKQRTDDTEKLRQSIAQDSTNYHSLVGTIHARLQAGTTPANPEVVAQWNQAQSALDRVSDDIARLASLSNEVASDWGLGSYILESAKAAYAIPGAVDEDHHQLSQIESDVKLASALIDKLVNEISEDVSRQSTYLGNERTNLVNLSAAIKNGELYGQRLANGTFSPTYASAALPASFATLSGATERQPLVVIRFNHPKVAYEKALYTAVSRALERRPDAAFDLVAVSPRSGTPTQMAHYTDASKRNAEAVLHSLTGMGLPAERVSLSATTSPSVQGSEVQIYVR